jgi:flagellar basal-body rod protein FlgG
MLYRAMNSAASGMTAQIFNLDVIANNMANSNTTGFKRSRTAFQDLYYQYYKLPGALDNNTGQRTPIGTAAGMGTQVTGTQVDFTQGSFLTTGQPLDLAIVGDGFFIVQDVTAPNALLYTRNGQITRNENGQLVIASANKGYPLEPSILIPQDATAINVGPDGTVTYLQAASTTATQAGQIQLAKFINNEGLMQYGNSMFIPTDASNQPTPGQPGQLGLGTIQQNTLEASNTEPVKELVDLIKTQRNVELNSQVVQATDQLLQLVSNLRRF